MARIVRVRVFRVPYRRGDSVARPAPAAVEEPGFTVDADTIDETRQAAELKLRQYGEDVRTLCHTPDGMAATVYAKAAK